MSTAPPPPPPHTRGRPPRVSGIRTRKELTVYMSPEEKLTLREHVERLGTNASDYVRRLIVADLTQHAG